LEGHGAFLLEPLRGFFCDLSGARLRARLMAVVEGGANRGVRWGMDQRTGPKRLSNAIVT
jgi:hypothetical protein